MRALSLVLVVVVAFLAIRWFRTGSAASAAEGGTEDAAASEASVRFLPPPVQKARPEVLAPAPAPASAAADVEQKPAEEPWPVASTPTASVPQESEVRVAAALVHGTPAEVQAAAASFPRDRALLLESFSWATAGERDLALSLAGKISDKDAVNQDERSFFEAALTGRTPAPAGSTGSPVSRAMEMSLLAREAKQALAAREHVEAALTYSRLLLAEVGAPWSPDRRLLEEWTSGLDQAQREHRWSPRGQWPAAEMKVGSGDNLIAVRLRYLSEHPGALMCTGLIERANRIRGFLQPNQVLKVPTDPVRILVDLDARWAFFLFGEEVAAAWPVGIGRPGEETPPGSYTVRNKLENPPWMKEGQEPIPFGDPRNPLGTRWIGWSRDGAKTSYGFHGTWDPESVGKPASDGCVRLLNEDVEELFQILPEGAPIEIQG